MFLLAHLSDPHIGPMPMPRLRELTNKRGLGLINWYRRRHRHHRADVLDAIVADMKAQSPGHIAVTGDLVNISLDAEFARAARWLGTLGKPADVTPSIGATTCAATTARPSLSYAGAGRSRLLRSRPRCRQGRSWRRVGSAA